MSPGFVADDRSGFWRGSKPGDWVRPEVRIARYVEGLEQYRAGRLSCVEAAELLGIGERHFRRLRERYEVEGAEGLIDRRRGRVSPQRAAVDRIEFVVEQYQTRYYFIVKHFHERLGAEHGFKLGYTWTKTVLQTAVWWRSRPSARRIAKNGRAGRCRG
jgi:transposase